MGKFKKVVSRCTSILVIIMLSMVVGCSAENESMDKNIRTLETVLKETYKVPNKELQGILKDLSNYTSIGEEEKINTSNDLDSYLENKYKSHFTEEMYEKYVGTYALSYITKSPENSEMKVKEVNVEQKENMENIYDYTAIIEYKNRDGSEEKKYEVKGQVNFSENGKIVEFTIRTDNNLYMDIASNQ